MEFVLVPAALAIGALFVLAGVQRGREDRTRAVPVPIPTSAFHYRPDGR